MSSAETIFGEIDVIAELANAHEGKRSKALEMINSISDSADAAKVQIFTADDLAVESHEDYDLYQELALSAADVREIVKTAHDNNHYLFADILGPEGLDRISGIDIDGYKIHSSDLLNYQLIRNVGELDKPTLISAGGATTIELRSALSTFENVSDADLGLVYGFQNFPTELEDTHLNRLKHLINEFGNEYPVGYTSHVDGGTDTATQLPAWAVATGASFAEVHVTIDRSKEGTDYYSSLEPEQFGAMAANIKTVQTALGEDSINMSENEREYRSGSKKCVVVTRGISTGATITKNDVELKRSQTEAQNTFEEVEKVIGKTTNKTLQEQTPVQTTDLEYTVAAVLACRAESTRLYGKPLQLVGDKSILAHVVTQLRKIDHIDEIVLAIADTPSKDSFIHIAEEYDLEFIVGSEIDVLSRVIKASSAVDADFVVRAMTENPFLYQEIIGKQIETAIQDNSDLTVPRKLPVGTFIEVVSSHALEKSHRLGEERHKSELVTSFITENPNSFRIVGINPPKSVCRPDIRLTVDNPSDLILARKLWDYLSELEQPYDLLDLIKFYDEEKLQSINDHKPDGETDEVIKQSWHIYGDSDEDLYTVYNHR